MIFNFQHEMFYEKNLRLLHLRRDEFFTEFSTHFSFITCFQLIR